MIDTIVFDIGNVLMGFDPMAYLRRILPDEETVQRVNGAIWGTGCWNALDHGDDEAETVRRMLAAEPGLEQEVRCAFENIGQCMSVREYAAVWIRDLKARRYRVLYLSNYSEHAMRANPDVLYFLPETDGGVFSCREKLMKPDPAIYRLLCERYALTPERCIFIDDNGENVEAARRFGMKAIRFTDFEATSAALDEALSPA